MYNAQALLHSLTLILFRYRAAAFKDNILLWNTSYRRKMDRFSADALVRLKIDWSFVWWRSLARNRVCVATSLSRIGLAINTSERLPYTRFHKSSWINNIVKSNRFNWECRCWIRLHDQYNISITALVKYLVDYWNVMHLFIWQWLYFLQLSSINYYDPLCTVINVRRPVSFQCEKLRS